MATAAIAAVVLLIYARAFTAYFFDDDFNHLVLARWFPVESLTPRFRWKPVFQLFFSLGSQIFGGSPAGYHATTIGIHIANGCLVMALASRLGMRRGFAFAAAMLFVVQPAYVSAVAWVGAVAEALVVLFGCSIMLAFLRFRRTGGRG